MDDPYSEPRELLNEDHEGTSPVYLGTIVSADPEIARSIINMDADGSGDTRSPWLWLRLANGDLMLACFPQGEGYFATEADPMRP